MHSPVACVLQPRRSCRVAAGAAADPRESAVCEIALAQCEWCVCLLARQLCMPRRVPTLRVRDAVFLEAAMAVRRRTTPPTSASVRSTSRFSASPHAGSKQTRGSGRQKVRRSQGHVRTGDARSRPAAALEALPPGPPNPALVSSAVARMAPVASAPADTPFAAEGSSEHSDGLVKEALVRPAAPLAGRPLHHAECAHAHARSSPPRTCTSRRCRARTLAMRPHLT